MTGMKKLTHAILIEGGNEDGRLSKAMELLKAHFADDPAAEEKLKQDAFEDLLVLLPDEEGKDITVDKIEGLVKLFKQKPFASTGKACLIPCGESMNEHAQNKMLKLLEEPARGNVIMILAPNAEKLLPTVRSRCARIWLGYPAPERSLVTEDLKTMVKVLIFGKGTFAEAGQILSKYEGSRDEAADFVRALQLFLRNLAVGRHAPDLIGDETGDKDWLKETVSKFGQKYADSMRRGVLLAEKALRGIERGDRVRYVLRGMALEMCANLDNAIRD